MNDQIAEEKISKITDSLNREVLGSLAMTPQSGGPLAVNYNQLLDIAKTMATAKHGVPAHLRGNPGDCLAIRELALNTGLSAYGLAQHCYIVKDVLCYDAQVIHAIIEKHAPLEARLRFKFNGEGNTRTCTVIGTFKNEATPCEYTTPQFERITPKNSPLWLSDPDQQLTYFAVRRWGRRYCPDILLGVFARDEVEDNPYIGAENAKDISPKLMDRLPGAVAGATGFNADVVDQGLADEKKSDTKGKTRTTKRAPKPKTAAEYIDYAEVYILAADDAGKLQALWNSEQDLRDDLSVRIEDRRVLTEKLEARIAGLEKSQ